MIVELANPQAVILQEINEYKLTQPGIALTYAFCIRQQGEVDFRVVNQAIIDRWSVSGLVRVKEMAWKHIEPDPKDKIE